MRLAQPKPNLTQPNNHHSHLHETGTTETSPQTPVVYFYINICNTIMTSQIHVHITHMNWMS